MSTRLAGPANGTRFVVAPGAVGLLPQIAARAAARTVLVIASPRAMRSADVPRLLAGHRLHHFADFHPNPQLDPLRAGTDLRTRIRPDLVVGLGGGSALDAAKVIRALRWPPGGTDDLIGAGFPIDDQRPALVLVPTTAGSGSEATCFATVYHHGTKISVDDPALAADVALVDADLTRTCTPQLTATAAFDALAHTVESLWSRRATDESRAHARRALALLGPWLAGPGRLDDTARRALMAGAHWAGRAINLTRTTAAHAFSYDLTIRYGVPHGLACMLNLTWLTRINLTGPAATRAVIAEVAAALDTETEQLGDRFAALIRAHGWSPRLREHGVSRDELPGLAERALRVVSRAANNPLALSPATVLPYLTRAW